MSSSLLERARKNFSLRLTLWYAVISALAYVVIFFLAHYSLSASLEKEDRKAIVSKFSEYRDEYREGGLAGLQTVIASERDSERPVLFFVRVVDQNNTTLLLSLPDQPQSLNLARIRDIRIDAKAQRVTMAVGDKEAVFEILSFFLPDENVMQIGKRIELREELLTRFRRAFLAVMVPAVLIGLIGGYLVTFRALRPIRRLTKTVTRITETGQIDARVPSGKTEDELSGLVGLFNNMLGRIENLITVMKESLDNVAHDLRTPMARFRALAENALQPSPKLGTCCEALSDGLEESDRIIKMVDTLMDIAEAKARTLKLDREPINVLALANEVVEVYRFVAEEKNLTIYTSLSGEILVSADPNRMRQALGNLLDNAVKYTPEGGIINVEACRRGGEIVIEVRDNGIGISEKDLSKIWDRLYRGDQSRSQRGLGLGLSLVKSIVELHGGRVEVLSKPQAGSSFIIRLPESN